MNHYQNDGGTPPPIGTFQVQGQNRADVQLVASEHVGRDMAAADELMASQPTPM